MARRKERDEGPNGPLISIVGPGMRVDGDCTTEGTLRVEGIVNGTIYAGKAVVVGKEAVVNGDVLTHDAVVSGEVTGTLLAASRLEVQATSKIHGEVRARRLHLEEGAVLNGEVTMGEEVELGVAPKARQARAGVEAEASESPAPTPSKPSGDRAEDTTTEMHGSPVEGVGAR